MRKIHYPRTKHVHHIRKDVRVGDVVETCNLHIGHVTSVNRLSGDMTVISFFSGNEINCDLYHCGIAIQSTKQINQKLTLFSKGGIEAIRLLWKHRCLLGKY